jgi:hypothetical protein
MTANEDLQGNTGHVGLDRRRSFVRAYRAQSSTRKDDINWICRMGRCDETAIGIEERDGISRASLADGVDSEVVLNHRDWRRNCLALVSHRNCSASGRRFRWENSSDLGG